MPRGLMVVQSAPRDASADAAYNDWYTNVHIPDVLAVPGFVGARRYRAQPGPTDADPPLYPYLAVYEIDADDLRAPAAELRARAAAGQTTPTDTMRTDPPAIVTFYELVE